MKSILSSNSLARLTNTYLFVMILVLALAAVLHEISRWHTQNPWWWTINAFGLYGVLIGLYWYVAHRNCKKMS